MADINFRLDNGSSVVDLVSDYSGTHAYVRVHETDGRLYIAQLKQLKLSIEQALAAYEASRG